MFSLPADRDIHDDLRMLKLVRGVARIPERRRTDEGASRHGDAAIAAVLAHAASRADPEIFEYRGAPPAGRASLFGDGDELREAGGDAWLYPKEDRPKAPARGIFPVPGGGLR
jgi:phage FluMu gp28-like protein